MMDKHIRKNMLPALTGGLLLGLPWAVPQLFFLVFIAWVPLLQLEEKTRHDANSYVLFNYALAAFLLWNILGTWWIYRAHLLGAVLIIFANALVQALAFWSASRVRTVLTVPLVLPLLLVWMGYEHFHQSWDLAWPWLNLGNALATAPKLIQWYEFTGIRGGTLWILLTNLAAWQLYASFRKKGAVPLAPAAAALLLVVVPVLFSWQIFQNIEDSGETVRVALVQPNLDPYTEKFIPEKQARHLDAFFKTADAVCDDDTQYLLGPETLIVEQIDEENPLASPAYRQLSAFQQKYPKLNILLGVHSYRKLDREHLPPGSRFNQAENFYYEAFNTALFLAPGAAPQFYHKTKLVPLFERMPFVQYLGFLGKYALELGGYIGTYSLRQERDTFALPDGSVEILPIVCFESVFGPYCARNLPAGKGFIGMITNDGWWKDTPGYRHHFNFSPMRAIECRRDMIRVANTGISALIDASGTVVTATPWWQPAVVKGKIHLRKGKTFFARHGDYLGRMSLGSAMALLLAAGIKRRKVEGGR